VQNLRPFPVFAPAERKHKNEPEQDAYRKNKSIPSPNQAFWVSTKKSKPEKETGCY